MTHHKSTRCWIVLLALITHAGGCVATSEDGDGADDTGDDTAEVGGDDLVGADGAGDGDDDPTPASAADLGDDARELDTLVRRRPVPGVNGAACLASPYNCRFRLGSSRVTNAAGGERWRIVPGASVRDGDGRPMRTETRTRMTFNYGQTRALAGKAHALALSTSNGSAGWYPIDHIRAEASFRARMGEVNGRDPRRGRMACYQIRADHDPTRALLKVVYDSRDRHERAGDYLPLVRASGARSANLVFSVPGFGLGGATTDHFLAGTRFQRAWVPTDSGRPSITIPLWGRDAAGRYRRRAGALRFFYGYVVAADGTRRFGWMAEDALTAASGCR